LVLRALAERMVAVMPDDAICARIGGEEFAILVPKTDLDEALACAESLRRDVEAIEVRTAFGPLPRVTISSGVVAHDGGATPPSVLMKQAEPPPVCRRLITSSHATISNALNCA
jgi:diguanylate cyclase (GGDEF)-like protein